MKKIISWIAVFCFMVGVTVHTYGQDNLRQIDIPLLGMTLSIPDDMLIFTLDMEEGDPSLAAIGAEKDDVVSQLASSSMFLDAYYTEGTSMNIKIMAYNNLAQDETHQFKNFEDEELKRMGELTIQEDRDSENPLGFSQYSIVEESGNKYLVLDYHSVIDGNNFYGQQYNTMVNDVVVCISVGVRGESFNETDQAILDNMIKSIQIDPQLALDTVEEYNKKNERTPEKKAFVFAIGFTIIVILYLLRQRELRKYGK